LTDEPSEPAPAVDETPADVGESPAEVTEAPEVVTEAPPAEVTEAPPAEVTEAPPAEVTEAAVTEAPAENLEQTSEGVNGVTEPEPMGESVYQYIRDIWFVVQELQSVLIELLCIIISSCFRI